ncbi:uncharacterized protein ZBAI_04660 [Zygosaccharomyces bailii ISA1307]|nr:uncharacterized protein ZBAI_04660 [Zygosaccharomyces bailii ISA1307]
MGKKKGKKSAAFKAQRAADTLNDNEYQNNNTDANDASVAPPATGDSLDDLNATTEELNTNENGVPPEETYKQENLTILNPEPASGDIVDVSAHSSPEVKPLFADEVDSSLLDPPQDAQSDIVPVTDSLQTDPELANKTNPSETQPLRIREPDKPVAESPSQEYGSSQPSPLQPSQPNIENSHDDLGPAVGAAAEVKNKDHPTRATSPRPEPPSLDTGALGASEVLETPSQEISTSQPNSPQRPTRTDFKNTHEVLDPNVESAAELTSDDRPIRATSPRPKPPPVDTTPLNISHVASSVKSSSPRPLPPLPNTALTEVDPIATGFVSGLSNPTPVKEISNIEFQETEKASKPTSPRPLPPIPVDLPLTKSDDLQKNKQPNKPPLPARSGQSAFSSRSTQITPLRASYEGNSADEEEDEVPGLRSFHRTSQRSSNRSVVASEPLKTAPPKSFEQPRTEATDPHASEMTDVDLNEPTEDNRESLATPVRLTKSKDSSSNHDEENQLNTPTRNLDPSVTRSATSHISPKTMRPETQSPISPPLPARGTSMRRYQVPPPLEQEMQSEEFRKNLSLTRARDNEPKPPPINRAKRLESAAEINLIANRFRETTQYYQTEDEVSRENIEKGQSALKSSFSTFLESLPGTPITPGGKFEGAQATPEKESDLGDDELNLLKTDWSFWTQVVNDFPSVAGNPEILEEKITEGIPEQVRGIIWQLIANSKSVEFEDIYQTLRDTASSHESSIRRDMKRTKFIPERKFESLFNVIKVYSVFDPDVGYTQGMAFIVTPLLLNTETEAEAFGLLVRLMKNYGLRNMYLPEMPGLMLMLYQFDRLLEEHSPQLYNHLTRQGVRSSMYATQWFLTFFAYKFPLGFVLRIYDIVFVEGVESFLKFAVNLMLKNIDNLLDLQFDRLLDFLKEELFYYYLKTHVEQRKNGKNEDNDNESVLKREITSTSSSPKRADIQDDEYDIDQFVWDAMNDVHITPISLRRYTSEYDEIHEIEQQKEAQYESIRIKNQQLQKEVRKLEHGYTLLNREHVDIANELIKNRLKIETLNDENNDMKSTILDLKRQLEERDRKQASPSPDDGLLPSDIRQDLNRTIKRNAEVMSENLKLQDKITELGKTLATLKTKNATPASTTSVSSHVPREKLSNGWSGLKKVFK